MKAYSILFINSPYRRTHFLQAIILTLQTASEVLFFSCSQRCLNVIAPFWSSVHIPTIHKKNCHFFFVVFICFCLYLSSIDFKIDSYIDCHYRVFTFLFITFKDKNTMMRKGMYQSGGKVDLCILCFI